MRMRKKPWANEMIQNRSDCVIYDPSEYKGKWHQLGYKTVVCEIGSGKGDYWINMAHKHPDELWIAIEKSPDAAAIGLKKCLDDTTANMKIIINDASKINEWFENGEIDRIHLNFSDPWPKKHHSKRRLTSNTFLSNYANLLVSDGCIIMKTDNNKLFEYSLITFNQENWSLIDVSVDYHSQDYDDVITEYESNFIALGQPIYHAIWHVPQRSQNV